MNPIISLCFFLIVALLFPSPADAGVSVIGSLTREKETGIGEQYEGTIQLKNNSDQPGEIKIFQTDYLFYYDGKNIYGEPGKEPRSNAGWIQFSPVRVIIPAGETSNVNYLVKVPDNSLLNGTYWSVIMVEGIGEGSPEASNVELNRDQFGVNHVFRYGIQMVTHINDTGKRKLRFFGTKLLNDNGKRTLQINIENNGERWMRSHLWTELYDEQGLYAGRYRGRKLRIYPGTSVRYRVDLSSVQAGNYRALVVSDSGGADLFGATYNLKIE